MQEEDKVSAKAIGNMDVESGSVFSMDEAMEMKGPQLMSKPPMAVTPLSGDDVMEEALRRAGVVAKRDERGDEAFLF
jgi:hypothetical protein